MKIIGVIAEYNPFHLGHQYHLNRVKAEIKPDGIICVMSGNFVQRGGPAIFDKWSRAEMALKGGADLILELPTCFATSTAEIFAESSIRLLAETKMVTGLSFGVEEYHEKVFLTLSKLLSDEPQPFKNLVKTYLKKGISFPTAREKAVIEYISKHEPWHDTKLIEEFIKKPNFILALEYMKAINKLRTQFLIFPVIRKGPNYHEKKEINGFLSATGIRNAMMQNSGTSFKTIRGLPNSSIDIINREMALGRGPIFIKDFEEFILYILRRTPIKELNLFFDVGEGLENRIKKASIVSSSLEQLISAIKTKRYPETKVSRILTHILLNVRKDLVASRKPMYFRVLGLSTKGAKILKQIKKRSCLPILSRASDFSLLNDNAKKMLNTDVLAYDIYSLAFKNPAYKIGGADMRKKVIYYKDSR
ncbi:MAG: nucleotidyltransferase [Thermoanaerobacterales bacterium]|nr:nucleotidyltransferase [Thermoanaerobacterales bacterium]